MSDHLITIGEPNRNYKSNYISKVPYHFFLIPIYTVKSYFFHSYENLYFLLLSLLQLCTSDYIALLPAELSPTGPYSTFTPLMLCFLMELFSNYISWFTIKKNEISHNYSLIPVFRNGKWKKIYSKDIYPGDIFKIAPDKEIAVDSILINCEENIPKISLSTLTGEPDLVPIKSILENKDFKTLIGSSFQIIERYPKNLDKFKSNLIINTNSENNNKMKQNKFLDEKYFLAGGGINCNSILYSLAISCGVDKKCYHQSKCEDFNKKNIFDRQNANYMMRVNTKILFIKIFIMSLCSIIYENGYDYGAYFNLYNIVQRIIQTWILFNGVIPFSIKIITVFTRYFQSKVRGNIIINNNNVIDQFSYIDKIISDKTGTLTKNEMNFSQIVFPNNTILNLEYGSLQTPIINSNLKLFQCLGVCIHFHNEKYSTIEDEVIRKRYYYLGCKIYQTSDELELILPDNTSFNYTLFNLRCFEFSSVRKRSSIIVQNKETHKYYIFCKGSINTIKQLVNTEDKINIDNNDQIILNNYPELRVMACAYKELDKDQIDLLMVQYKSEGFDENTIKLLETDLTYLGIIGLKDSLQENIKKTVEFLYLNKKPICVCTGDRKETALAISKECGIIYNKDIELTPKFILHNINKSYTLVFSGNFLTNTIMTSYEHMTQFIDLLSSNPNFIAYSLLPEHKKYLVNILESQNINVLSIGDGNNDIPMLKTATMGVGIKNKNNYQVTESSDIIVHKFKNLKYLYLFSNHCLIKNLECSEFTLFKTTFLSFSIFFNILINQFQFNNPIIQGIELQGFHLFWATFPILFYTCFLPNQFSTKNCIIQQLHYRYFKWIFSAIISSWTVIYFTQNFENHRWYQLFLLVLILNLVSLSKINKVSYKFFFLFLHLIGIILAGLYIIIYHNIELTVELFQNMLLIIFINISSFLFITNS
jgi:phospholipid-transporting ATPase